MLERYLISDSEEYVDVDCVREALGIKEDENIFRAIEKLKEERDELKGKVDRMKKRANAAYGVSCGYSEYSGDKAPTFHCNVISYSWDLNAISACSLMDEPSYAITNDSIRVELDLTPTANYKGAFDLDDLKKYIQEYGREKKLGIIESVDYQNAKAARAELSYLYKQVLGKEKLDRDLSPHEVMKAILDEYKRVRDSQFAFSQCLRSVYMEIYEGTGYDIDDIYAAPDKLANYIVTRYNSARMSSRLETLSEVDEHIDELCDKYTIVQPDRRETTRERLDYIFGVLAEHRELANNNFNKAERFRKEKRAVEDSLAELRAKIREIYRSVVDDEWDEHLSYTSALNDINEEYKRVVHNFEERTADWYEVQKELDRYRLAVGSLCNIPAEHRDDISWIEDAFNNTKKDYLKWQTQADRLARLRSDICTALCLGHEDCDGNIIGRIHMMQDCHDKLCKDYTELRKNIWDAMGRKPETLPDETARLVGEVRMIAEGEKLLIEFRDAVAEAIGITYPTTNNFLLKRVADIYKERGEAHDLAMELDRKCIDLTAKNSDLQQKFEFQSGLRQQWHARYESEHERANGVQKCLDKTREALRVKDISLETAKKQYEKVCNNLETAECAINGMKSKIRELQKENASLKKDVASLTGDASVDLYEEENDGTADTDD